MSVQTVPVTSQVPKESKEVVDLAHDILVHLLSGGKVVELAKLIPAALVAADGSLLIGPEVESDHNDELAGYGVQKIMSALKTKKAVPQA
jgi:hypothetical protein